MYISSLDLYGFKSFLKKSTLHFGKGITAIVGPNGCGKTNIVDAVRWVLGEQKSSILRGERGTDVIFYGTATRRPLSFAEISLTIHNVSGRIPIQYSDIMITRRIYRNSESEYFINKNPCRLRDIIDLFIDTGMGANAYSVIELKMIEDILSETPEEKKRLFEEAAGVNKYRIQRKATIRKLEVTREDLLRVNDIITEVESKVKNLKRQLRRYDKYQETTQKLIDAEVDLASCRVLEIKQRLVPITAEQEQVRAKLQDIVNNLKIKEEEWQIKQRTFEKEESLLEQKTVELDSLKSQSNDLLAKGLVLKEQHNSIIKATSRLEYDIGTLSEKITGFENEKAFVVNELKRFESNLGEKRDNFELLSDKSQKAENRFNQLGIEVQSLQDKRYSFLKQQAENSARHNSLKENISQNSKRLEDINSRIQKQLFNEKAIQAESGDLENKVHSLEERLIEYKSKADQEKMKYHQLVKEDSDLRKNLQKIELETEKLFSQIQFYSEIIQSKEGFGPGLQYVLDNISDFDGIRGAFSDLLSVDPKYYLSVEAVIKDISQLIVADDRESAIRLLRKLSKLGRGKVSIIPLDVDFKINKVEAINNSKVRLLSSFINCDRSIQKIKEFLFQNVYCCDDSIFDNLINEPDLENSGIVSDKGRFRDPNGFFVGGSGSSESNILVGRTEKVEKLKQKHNALSGSGNSLKKKLVEVEKSVESESEEIQRMEDSIKSIEVEIDGYSENLRENRSKFAQYENLRIALDEEKIALKAVIENSKERLKRDNPEIDSINSKIAEIDNTIEDRNKKLEEMKSYLDETNRDFQEKRIELINLENKYRNLIDSKQVLKRSIDELSDRKAKALQEKESNKKVAESIDKELKSNSVVINDLNQKISEAESEINDLRKRYQEFRKGVQDINTYLFQLRTDKEKLTERLSKLELESSKCSASEKEIRSVLSEKYGVEVSEETSGELSGEEEPLRRVNRYKKQLEMIGMVNMAVKEEYESEASRLFFLREQRDDLVQSEKGLNNVIVEIDKIVHQRFMEVFNKVKINFKSTFSIFFQGGEADLQLVGSSDPLEANIEILVCPKGKKMRSLKALSAGEKALTAIALLFAIYQIKPSPFCILDEVDAPLDDENIRRFTNVLKTFSQKTQFIVVTHNKLTMNVANTLYGVTMGESGVSQIVSVRLE